MKTKGEVVKFPLGSSANLDAATAGTLEEVVRQGMTNIIAIGLDAEGTFTTIFDPGMSPERVHFLLSKALLRAADEPLDMDIEEDDEDEDTEDDEREDQE
jgi:diacylglycerol kinase family enzyme